MACRQLGFEGGSFRGVEDLPPGTMLRPSWLADIPCASGNEETIQDCGTLAFGDTATCGFPQRLACINSEIGMCLLCAWLTLSESFGRESCQFLHHKRH